jgi:hypothetical protein
MDTTDDLNEDIDSTPTSDASWVPMANSNTSYPPWYKSGNCLWNPHHSPSTYTTANIKGRVESTFINPTIEQSAAMIQSMYSSEQQNADFLHKTPMLTAIMTPRQSNSYSSEESPQILNTSSKEISRLEKSFSTSLNFFSTLSPPSFHNTSQNMTPLHGMNPLESSLGENHGNFLTPRYMEMSKSASETDCQDRILQGNVNSFETVTKTPDRSHLMDLDTTVLLPPLNTPSHSKEQEKPLNLSNPKVCDLTAQEASTGNRSICAFSPNSLLCTPKSSYSDNSPQSDTHCFQSEENNLELKENTKSAVPLNQEMTCDSVYHSNDHLGNEGESAHISLVYQVVEDIQAAWPPSNTDTSCILGKPLKTSSPFGTRRT